MHAFFLCVEKPCFSKHLMQQQFLWNCAHLGKLAFSRKEKSLILRHLEISHCSIEKFPRFRRNASISTHLETSMSQDQGSNPALYPLDPIYISKLIIINRIKWTGRDLNQNWFGTSPYGYGT